MKRFCSITLILMYSVLLNAQNFNIRSVNSQTEEKILPKYDTTSLYLQVSNLFSNKEYYNGEKIIFLPKDPSDKKSNEYYTEFILGDYISIPELADTIWFKVRKDKSKAKPTDYKVDIPRTNIYKYERVNNVKLSYFGDNILKEYSSDKYSGFATSDVNITGKEFEIVGCSIDKNDYRLYYDVVLHLKDSDNMDVFFKFEYESNDDKDKNRPIIIKSALEKISTTYLNNKYMIEEQEYIKTNYVAQNINTGKWKIVNGEVYCKEVAFMQVKGSSYLKPHFIFTDNENTEFVMHFTKPDEYSYLTSISYRDQENLENPLPGYGNRYAYLLLNNLIPLEKYIADKKSKEEKAQMEKLAAEKALAEKKARLTKQYGRELASIILENKVQIGMTTEMCREAWGLPEDINSTSGSWGIHEQWVYGGGNYLYFENGILTSIQN